MIFGLLDISITIGTVWGAIRFYKNYGIFSISDMIDLVMNFPVTVCFLLILINDSANLRKTYNSILLFRMSLAAYVLPIAFIYTLSDDLIQPVCQGKNYGVLKDYMVGDFQNNQTSQIIDDELNEDFKFSDEFYHQIKAGLSEEESFEDELL